MDRGEYPEQRLLAHAVKAMVSLDLELKVMWPETRTVTIAFGGGTARAECGILT